jgi:Cys-tRNA(Pro)/Cys-tRNA(Cys) deacylase
MTPAIELLKQHHIAHQMHEYRHEQKQESNDGPAYGAEAAAKLGIDEAFVFKTLIINVDDRNLAVAVIPVSAMLSMKLIARALGGKKAVMASQAQAERSSGYVLGGISPLGQKKRLRTIIDRTATDLPTIFISAGRRGLEIELAAEDLRQLTEGVFANLQQC